MNCWEFKHCGREPNGTKVAELGVCPAATEKRADGIHNGKNGGRACWVVTGSLHKIEHPELPARSFDECQACDFYTLVRKEEHAHFQVSTLILNTIRKSRVKSS